jgi:hypothetical protein
VDVLARALNDPDVRFGRKRALQQRATTLLTKMNRAVMKDNEKREKARKGRGRGRGKGRAKQPRGAVGKKSPANPNSVLDYVPDPDEAEFEIEQSAVAAVADEIGVAESDVVQKYKAWKRKLLQGDVMLSDGAAAWNVHSVSCRRIEGCVLNFFNLMLAPSGTH